MFTWQFWRETLERAVKTAAQFGIGGWGLGEGANAFEVDWQLGLGFVLTGFVLSILTSVASGQFTQGSTPNLAEAR